MKKTLQDQYLLIKEGKGHKGVFLTEAKRQFPDIVRNAATFEEAAASLKTKNIIAENIVGLTAVNSPFNSKKKESFETAFENFLAEAKKENEDEKVKAEEKKVSKPVEKDLEKNFDYSDEKNPDNMIFDQIMMGYYAEMKDPKNADKTMQELKDIVFKNLSKDPIYYTKDGQFGIKDLGYVTEAPGLGTPKEPKGKYKSSGYGDLKESIQPINEEDKLRKVIREMIDAELEEAGRGFATMGTINLKGDGDGKLFIPKYYILPPVVRKKLNLLNPGENAPSYNESMMIPHIKVLPDNTILYSNYLVNALDNPSDNRNPLNNILKNFESNFYWNQFKTYTKKFISSTTVKYPVLGREAVYNVLEFPNDFEVLKLKDWVESELSKQYAKLQKAESGVVGRGRPVNIESLKKFIANLESLNQNPEGGMVVVLPQMFEESYHVEEGVLGVRDTDVSPGYFVDLPISYSDDKNVAHYSDDDRYSSQEDLLDPEDYFEQIQGMSDGDAFNYLKGLRLGRGEILTVLKSRKSSLRESVEKDLMDINKEAEHEVLQSKLDKIDALIDLRRSKLGKLDEDEDMKALTDKKKVKELEKDIKKLEVARNKVEKMMSKFKGKKSSNKKVIDEDEPIDENLDVNPEYVEDATERLDAGQKVDSIRDTYSNLGIDQKSDLTDYLNTIAPDDLTSDYVY
jgi:hypothetical protein